jgi:hypothetical protein
MGSDDPVSMPGFSLLPPASCFKEDCEFDGKPIVKKLAWIPKSCVPIPVSIRDPGAPNPVFDIDVDLIPQPDTRVQLTYRDKGVVNQTVGAVGEQRIVCSITSVGASSVQLAEESTGKPPNGTYLDSTKSLLYITPLLCNDALKPGERCHPLRYNGTLEGGTDAQWYDNTIGRKICPYIMPCEPPVSCGANSTCAFGYMDYYAPYREDKQCNRLHYTLRDGSCFAPRCSMCDISEENPHFRLDGACVPCPQIPWLLPAIMVFVCIIGLGAMIVLSKSKVSRNVLRIGVDYFQVLSMFRTAKVAWPVEIKLMLFYFQFFQMDIDLTGPECAFRSIVTYENKFYFKALLPFLGGALIATVFSIVYVAQRIKKCFSRRRAMSAADTEKKVPAAAVVTSITMSMVYFLYLTVCRAGFDVLNCQDTMPPTGKFYMVSMPLEECYKDGGMQLRLLPYAVLLLLVYGVGFPAGIAFIFALKKKTILADQSLRLQDKGDTYLNNPNYGFRRACGQMYGMYQPKFVLWPTLILIRKIFLCAANVLFKENPTYQLSATLSIMFAAFIFQVKANPFLDVKEKARLMREQAEANILKEVLRLERQSMLVRVQGNSYGQLMHTMRKQIDEQDKIMAQNRMDIFNL